MSNRLNMDEISDKVFGGKRISPEEGSYLLEKADLLSLGLLADQVRKQKHPDGIVTFVIDRNINYTNICCCGCGFCAFYRPARHPEGYLLTKDEVFQKIEELLAMGGTQVLMQGDSILVWTWNTSRISSRRSKNTTRLHCIVSPL